MSSSPSALPTPRQLLTSILNQISEIPAPTAPVPGNGPEKNSSAITRTDSFPEPAREPPTTNPLRLVDARHRPLFTTLHVLFPSLLLPALDLLDRGLVTRLLSREEAGTAVPAEGGPLVHQGGGDGAHETQQEGSGVGSQVRNPTAAPPGWPHSSSVYLVRSAQKPARRPYGGGGDAPTATSAPVTTSTTSNCSSQRTYVVHTAAWNCTCAAFAFAACPPLAGAPSLLRPAHSGPEDHPTYTMAIMDDGDGDDAEEGQEDAGGEGGEGRGPWEFGGESLDGCAGGVPPCCKHLLACVLAERWGCGLGRYVAWRELGREEMAGVFADI